MVVLDLLYKLLIGPLQLFFEVLFTIAYRMVGDPALAIVVLSLAMNFLVLPLYRRADAVQEAQREQAMRMKPWNDHIKRTFKGDERFMMQQAYNRENGYKPTDALKGSVSLLLEIPFFIAAYQFLSHLQLLNGVPLGPIADLGAPDALLNLGGISINVLPIVMTAINLVSAAIYMKGMPASNKIQMYGVAAIFLVLLYNSPAGLVFYWTLNNLFSLVKNILYKTGSPFAALKARLVSGNRDHARIREATRKDDRTFLLACMFMALLTGAIVPASVVSASPAEFVDLASNRSPLWDLAGSLALGVGTFVIWFGVFYRLATPRGRTVFLAFMLFLCVASVANFLLFGTDLGTMSPQLEYDTQPVVTPVQVGANIAVLAGAAVLVGILWRYQKGALRIALACLCLAAGVGVAVTAGNIQATVAANLPTGKDLTDAPRVTLSKEGQNVVVIMLDRAVGTYLPYLMHERPDLKEKLDGFTYYPNTVSYGAFTNTGIPALFGGSEYRPEQLNERSSELLRDKHNESLQVLPKIFSDHGFGVTLFDPSYANYQWTPDLSVFDDIPNTKAYITMDGSFTDNESLTKGVHGGGGTQSDPARTFFCHGLFKTAPVVLQPLIYSSGTYNSATALSAANALSGNGTDADREVTAEMLVKQLRNDAHVGVGVDMYFTRAYGVLKSMPQITDIVDDDQGQYFLMTNDSAHQPMILVEPSYEPALWTDNTVYDEEHRVRTDGAGGAIEFPEESGDREYSRLLHYEVNMASLLALGEWFDYLREQGVWDNTRVIICSDHSRQLWTEPDMTIDAVSVVDHEHWDLDLLVFNCLFMVKDFGAQGFTVDESFMTNADTPVMALKDVVEHPVNPFTGGRIDSSYKDEPEQRILYYPYWDVEGSTDKTFGAGLWYSVRDDVRVRKNWEYLGTY